MKEILPNLDSLTQHELEVRHQHESSHTPSDSLAVSVMLVICVLFVISGHPATGLAFGAGGMLFDLTSMLARELLGRRDRKAGR